MSDELKFSKRKILVFINDPKFLLSHRLALVEGLRESHHDLIIITGAGCEVEKIRQMGFCIYSIPFTRSGMNPVLEIKTLWHIFKLYRKLKPDLVHHVTIKPIIYGSIIARICRVPTIVNAVSGLGYVFTTDTLLVKLIRRLVIWGYRYANFGKNTRVILQNDGDKSIFIANKMADEKKLRMIYGAGVDLDEFTIKRYTAPEKIMIALPARMLWSKGVAEFIAAAQHIKKLHKNVQFMLIGSYDPNNPSAVGLKQLQAWQMQNTVFWWGFSDISCLMPFLDIICLPSYGEGMPKVLLEAAAAGKCIVASDIPGISQLVNNDEHGVLVPIKDASSLTTALLDVIENPKKRALLGVNARTEVEMYYQVDKIVDQTYRVYAELN